MFYADKCDPYSELLKNNGMRTNGPGMAVRVARTSFLVRTNNGIRTETDHICERAIKNI